MSMPSASTLSSRARPKSSTSVEPAEAMASRGEIALATSGNGGIAHFAASVPPFAGDYADIYAYLGRQRDLDEKAMQALVRRGFGVLVMAVAAATLLGRIAHRDLPVASHDDDSAEEVRRNLADGIAILETAPAPAEDGTAPVLAYVGVFTFVVFGWLVSHWPRKVVVPVVDSVDSPVREPISISATCSARRWVDARARSRRRFGNPTIRCSMTSPTSFSTWSRSTRKR